MLRLLALLFVLLLVVGLLLLGLLPFLVRLDLAGLLTDRFAGTLALVSFVVLLACQTTAASFRVRRGAIIIGSPIVHVLAACLRFHGHGPGLLPGNTTTQVMLP